MKANLGLTYVVNFIEKASCEQTYPGLQNALDRQLHTIRSQGIRTKQKRSEDFKPEIEAQLWSLGLMGYKTPKALLNSVFFYNGKNFCLRGDQEHHLLCFSQLHRATNPDRYVYKEFGSKNLCGGVSDASEGK